MAEIERTAACESPKLEFGGRAVLYLNIIQPAALPVQTIGFGIIRGKVIACHCKPAACHGDVLAAHLNSQVMAFNAY
ncbi:DUF4326 domain-containing protein [Pseudomonas lactis]|uniref:DUF4326 domain-containing protein n=1 Tax=Pseudomonas lactis TaxID=1615674 RepID=UPI0031F708F7